MTQNNNEPNKEIIWNKTDGHCHFCGGKLIFENYGRNKFIEGNWNIDHILPRAVGGENKTANYLPICGECNGLKWHRTGKQIQELIRFGLVALREKRKGSQIGRQILEIYKFQQEQNKKRRSR